MDLSDVNVNQNMDSILGITEDLIQVHDLDSLLDKILTEARKFTRAEAGTIFLVKGGRLRFSYVHNEVMFSGQKARRYNYRHMEMELDQKSLAGYVAVTGESLLVEDAYQLGGEKPYSFNCRFDQQSGYRSRSLLLAPMRTSRGKVVGVLQIINARDEKGNLRSFNERDRNYVTFYANNAALAIERAIVTREIILRTIKMAQLRDPKETGTHVNRVGAYSAEIYECWATRAGLSGEEIEINRDIIRVASMLHDVGKVAISDTILKKPGRLTTEEFHTMKYHTVFGAQFFRNPATELDEYSLEIALNHHERWDGNGYPGHLSDPFAAEVPLGKGKKGEEIPLMARIVALADVYDALISKRVYKDAWPEEKALAVIKEESGSQFDPAVVEAFLEVYEVIRSIPERYPME